MIHYWTEKKNKMALRMTGALISLGFLFTTVAAPFAQASFWEERRQAVENHRQGQEPVQLASAIPSVNPRLGLDLKTLENSLRQTKNLEFSSRSRSLSKEAGVPLPLWDILADFGTIEKVSFVRSHSLNIAAGKITSQEPLVIHVQDVHDVYAVQKNLAFILKELMGMGVELVGLEGSEGELEGVETWREYTDKESLLEVAGYLLETGLLTGSEVAGLTQGIGGSELYGLEKKEDYLKQVNAFKDTLNKARQASEWTKSAAQSLTDLKQNFYSPDLTRLSDEKARLDKKEMKLGDWLSSLAKILPAGEKYPNVKTYIELHRVEQSINFDNVSKEQQKALKELSEKSSRQDLEILLQDCLLYRLGRLDYVDFYASLKNHCRKAQVSLGHEFANYIQYAAGTQAIKPEALFKEVTRFEEAVWKSALASHGGKFAKALHDLESDFRLIEKGVAFTFTPQDWEAYVSREGQILDFDKRLTALQNSAGAPFGTLNFEPIKEIMAGAAVFNRQSYVRTNTFVEKLRARMKEKNLKVAVLVAGGYHTAGIEEELSKGGISYITVRPKIDLSKIQGDFNPMRAFTRSPLPLEKLFAPEKISIPRAHNLGSASELGLNNTEVPEALKALVPANSSEKKSPPPHTGEVFSNQTKGTQVLIGNQPAILDAVANRPDVIMGELQNPFSPSPNKNPRFFALFRDPSRFQWVSDFFAKIKPTFISLFARLRSVLTAENEKNIAIALRAGIYILVPFVVIGVLSVSPSEAAMFLINSPQIPSVFENWGWMHKVVLAGISLLTAGGLLAGVQLSIEKNGEDIIEEYKKPVEKIAKRYYYRFLQSISYKFLELQDLIQAGWVGLLEARNRYQPILANNLMDYAIPYIKSEILNMFRQSSSLKENEKTRRFWNAQTSARKKLTELLGRNPLSEEIAREMNMSPKKYMKITKRLGSRPLIVRDRESDEGDDQPSIVERFPDGKLLPGIIVEKKEALELLQSAVAMLPSNEKKIIEFYFKDMKMEEIAKSANLSFGGAHKILETAIKRLERMLNSPRNMWKGIVSQSGGSIRKSVKPPMVRRRSGEQTIEETATIWLQFWIKEQRPPTFADLTKKLYKTMNYLLKRSGPEFRKKILELAQKKVEKNEIKSEILKELMENQENFTVIEKINNMPPKRSNKIVIEETAHLWLEFWIEKKESPRYSDLDKKVYNKMYGAFKRNGLEIRQRIIELAEVMVKKNTLLKDALPELLKSLDNSPFLSQPILPVRVRKKYSDEKRAGTPDASFSKFFMKYIWIPGMKYFIFEQLRKPNKTLLKKVLKAISNSDIVTVNLKLKIQNFQKLIDSPNPIADKREISSIVDLISSEVIPNILGSSLVEEILKKYLKLKIYRKNQSKSKRIKKAIVEVESRFKNSGYPVEFRLVKGTPKFISDEKKLLEFITYTHTSDGLIVFIHKAVLKNSSLGSLSIFLATIAAHEYLAFNGLGHEEIENKGFGWNPKAKKTISEIIENMKKAMPRKSDDDDTNDNDYYLGYEDALRYEKELRNSSDRAWLGRIYPMGSSFSMLALFTIGISLSVLAITPALSLAAAIPFSAEYIGAIDAGFNFKYALPFVPIYLLFRFFNVGKDSPKLMFGGPHIVHFISAFTGRPFSRYLDLNGNTKWQIIWGDLKAIFSPKSDEDKAISAIRWIRKLSSAAPKNALAIQKRIAALGPKPLLAAAGMAGEDFFDKQNIAETAAVLREIMNAKAGKKVDVSVLVPNPGPLLEKIYNQEFKPEQIFSVKIQPQDKEAVDEVIDAFAKSAALRAQTLQIKQIPGAEFTHKISRNTLVIDVSSLFDPNSSDLVTDHIKKLLDNRWLRDPDHKIAFVANNMSGDEIKSKLSTTLDLNLLEKNTTQVRFGSNNALTKAWLEGWIKNWEGAQDYSVLSDNPQRWDMAILLILSATHSKPISSTQEMEKKIKDMFLVSLSQ